MFAPKYKITPKLLKTIKEATILVERINRARFPVEIIKDLRREAVTLSAHASTSIEGNPLTLAQARELFKKTPINVDDFEKEILNWKKAQEYLNKIQNNRETIGLSTLLGAQKEVARGLIAKDNWGKLRSRNVYVKNNKIQKIVYMAPLAKDIKKLLSELIDFVNANTVDPIIAAGLFHRQFVIIHPFADGNGRTSRLLTLFILKKIGLKNFDLFSFDDFYAKDKGRYFEKIGVLGHYYDLKDKIDFTSWLEYFTDGIVHELERVNNRLKTKQLTPENTLHPYHKLILGYIEKNGFISDKQYSALTKRAKPTRNLDFRKLIRLELIKKYGGGRATYYKMR